ncbi:MAG: serine/threonine-protein kinase [Pyrinomonadaceae bacterium]
MLASNTILQGRYRVIRQLGHGGMGAVYEALNERVSSLVALKETFAANDLQREAFEREAKLLANLDHEAFPRVMDHFYEGDGQYLVMELVRGNDLWELLQIREAPFPQEKVLEWADQLLDALDELHNHVPPVVHRDIKPANLKLTPRGKIKLLDFGIAKGASGQMTYHTSAPLSVVGFTPHFAPLEQTLRSDRRWVETFEVLNAPVVAEILQVPTDPRSDLYSLGATLYHLMTNHVPSDAATRALAVWSGRPDPLAPANIVNPQISARVGAVLQQAMALVREDRPESAAAMRKALRTAAELPLTLPAVTVTAIVDPNDAVEDGIPTRLLPETATSAAVDTGGHAQEQTAEVRARVEPPLAPAQPFAAIRVETVPNQFSAPIEPVAEHVGSPPPSLLHLPTPAAGGTDDPSNDFTTVWITAAGLILFGLLVGAWVWWNYTG